MVDQLGFAIGIIMTFVLLGVALPFVNSAFGSQTNVNIDDINTDISGGVQELEATSALAIVKSVVKMFFWTFGDLPFWLDAIFVVFRIALVLILIQYIPFIG